MTLHKLKLVAPNSAPIVGLKLADGSLASFEYSYDDETQTSTYILADRGSSPLGEENVLVDSEGNEWDSSDVEWHSLVGNKFTTRGR